MALRKWLVRGLAISALGLLALTGILYQWWTNPSAVRQQVLAKLAERFPGAIVSVASANLQLLGHIAVGEVRMARRDDLDRTDFFYAPSSVIYHDKEQMLDGKLAIRKVELHRPRIRAIRERDGRLNLYDVAGPVDLAERVPTIVIHQGTLLVEDRSASGLTPLGEIHDVHLTVVNDPLPTLTVEGNGISDVAGPIRLTGRYQRTAMALSLQLEASAVSVGPTLVERLAAVAPAAAAHLRRLKGNAAVTATVGAHLGESPGSGSVGWPAESVPSPGRFTYDISCRLTDGEFDHAQLPIPLDHLDVTIRCVNGKVPLAALKGRAGSARVSMTVRDASLTAPASAPLEDRIGEMELAIDHLPVTPELFARLPESVQVLQADYSPTGPASLTARYRRTAPGQWEQHLTLKPEGMKGVFSKFAYPVDDLTGSITSRLRSDRNDEIAVDLRGKAAGRPLTIAGAIRGPVARSSVDLLVSADRVPIDERLLRALPPACRAIADQFHPTGLVDVRATIRREANAAEFANRYRIAIHDATARYDLFPYPLEEVTGVLDILPDHWECRDFRGTHKEGEIRVTARSVPAPAARVVSRDDPSPGNSPHPPDRGGEGTAQIEVVVHGTNIPLDQEFEQALAPPQAPGRQALQQAWQTLCVAGRMNFTAEVVDVPGQPSDIDVAVNVTGCTMQPRFFPYALTDVAGSVRYVKDRVYLEKISARHGRSELGLERGLLALKPGGGFKARLERLSGSPLVADADFLRALDRVPAMRKALEALQLRDPVGVATVLEVETTGEPNVPPAIRWDGGLAVRDARLSTGVEWSGVTGVVYCSGSHTGHELESVVSNVQLQQASVLGQPLTDLRAKLEVRASTPDVVRISQVQGRLFGGTVGAEGRFEFGRTPRYDLVVKGVQMQLEQFGKQNFGSGAEVQGPATATIHLHGEGTDVDGLRGQGSFEVPRGKLYKLPILLDLVKALGLRKPDGTAFEHTKAVFSIEGPRVVVQDLTLDGNAINLRGAGELNLDGTDLNLDFHADWAQVIRLMPPGVERVPQTLSNQLLKLKVRGRVGDVKLEKELVPGVMGPLMRMIGGK